MAPFDGAGNYSLPAGSDVVTGDIAIASDLNIPLDDIEAALSQVLLRSGVAPMTGDLDMGGFDIVNAGGPGGTLLTEDDIGTSGHKIPQLDVANTWSGDQTNNGFVSMNVGATVGDDAGDTVIIKGTLVSPYGATLLAVTDAANLRSALGLGTAAVQNIGTTGANVPLLNGVNTWSGRQSIAASSSSAATLVVQDTSAIAGSGPYYVALWIDNDVGGGAGNICGIVSINPSANTCIYGTVSDGRLKQDVVPLADSGSVIDSLNPVRFRWRHGDHDPDFGFIAQDLREVVPQAVAPGRGNPGDADFVPWGMQKGALEAILVAEIKALRARVAALEAAAGL